MKFFKRFFQEPKESFFLFGPRGTGKSTLIRRDFENAVWIDLLKPEVLRIYSAYPERLNDVINANPDKMAIVIDEVQKVPSLLAVVHSIIEEKKGKQFILTGSSARKLKRTGADLLGGRALRCMLHPFMPAEVKEAFSLESALQHGLLPVIFESKTPHRALEGYVGLYLKEEIQSEGLVRNLEDFSRFLEGISFSHASTLNITNVAKECAVKRKTVESYIDILQELLLAFRLPIFAKRAKRELSVHPKFYLFDAGVYRILRPRGHLDRPEEIEGLALEGLVAQSLVAWNDYNEEKHEISFWRTRAGLEVDFIVYGPKGLWALEVKNSRRISPSDIKALEAFCIDYPTAKGVLLYRGEERIYVKNILCIPVEPFLKQLIPNHSLDDALN